jgi:hypothetical protein
VQLPQRVFFGALIVPMLLASVGTAFRPAAEIEPGHLVFAVRSSEIVLAGTAGTAVERQQVVDAVRELTAAHRVGCPYPRPPPRRC